MRRRVSSCSIEPRTYIDVATSLHVFGNLRLETTVGYSCSASQICGCAPKKKTSEAIFELNAIQRDRGITPQCDLNGTLCGEPKKK